MIVDISKCLLKTFPPGIFYFLANVSIEAYASNTIILLINNYIS